MSGASVDLKEHVEQKDMFDRHGRYDFVFVMLDKRIDHLSEEIKEVRSEIKDVRSEIKDVRSEVKDLRDEMRGELKDVRSEIKEVRNEIKEVKNEVMDVRNEIKEVNLQTNQRIDGLYSQMVSMKLWGIGLLIAILLVVLAPHIISLLG